MMYTGFLVLFIGGVVQSFQLLPPVHVVAHNETAQGFPFDRISTTIYITDSLASHSDSSGLSLIPPTGMEFAQTFLEDLNEASGKRWTIRVVDVPPINATGIILEKFLDDTASLSYESGQPTEEGYTLETGGGRAVIRGSGARGMWWGTRTLLQQLILSNWTTLPAFQVTDAPAYATRGFMLDAGRKWYAPSFLKELCTYASFFKMSEFHYHTSDNYPLNRGHNDTWNEVYSQFSLRPESEELQGLVQRRNETLTRADFEDLQQHCAGRGITIVPEIEAPGHCLTITKYKPELALPKKDLLNLTHPDSIPTVKRIWGEFLPWFKTKEVHIGADEYDPKLADVYISFVNEMSMFINETAGKRVRIWGTYEPSQNFKIRDEVIIQHWQYGQSDPVQLQADGYDIINTEDWWAYMSLKNDHMPIFPAPYAPYFNETRVLNFGGRDGWQWQPALFNPVNLTEQLYATAKGNKGAILAAWNDNGPDASTQLEAYYAIRRGIPLVAARAWSGSRGPLIEAQTAGRSITLLSSQAPGHNLDRQLQTLQPNQAGELISWARGETSNGDTVRLGYGSKGLNYTLSLTVTGPFTLSSADVTLRLSATGTLTFVSDGYEYPLQSVSEQDGFDSGFPGRIWANATSSSHKQVTVSAPANITITGDMIGGSRAWINGVFAGRFEVFIFGGKNTVFSWSQMAFVAPLDNLEGSIQRLVLKDGVQSPGQGSPTPAPTPTTTPGEPATGAAVAASINTAMIVVLLCVLVGPLSMSLV